MVDWKTLSFEIPDIETCTDAELEALFYSRRDGRWSSPIKQAIERFGARGLDLDSNWASTSPDWVCPICARSKSQLVRLTTNGILLARLDVHHDHLADYMKARLRERFGTDWPARIPPNSHHVENIGADIAIRFERHIVCHDCNVAEATVKRQAPDIHRYFSFRPGEIAQFISVSANSDHNVDHEKARTLWTTAEEEFRERLAIADALVDAMARGVLTRERGNLPIRGPDADLQPLHFLNDWFHDTGADGPKLLRLRIDAIRSRSLAFDGVGSSGKKTTAEPAPIDPPTDEELRGYDGGGSPKLWANADESWTCPVCERTKREILRPAKNKPRRWSGRLHEHHEYSWEDLGEDDFVVAGHRTVLICWDCAEVKAEAKRRDPALSEARVLLQISDLKKVIAASPNRRHVVDWDTALQLAKSRHTWTNEVDDHWQLYMRATNCRTLMQDVLSRVQGDEGRALAQLVSLYRSQYPGWPDDKIAEHLQVLLAEADRLAPEIGVD